MTARIGVVLFPGSNCEFDVIEAVTLLGGEAEICWHGDRSINGVDAVVVPGGFAHGDYLRPGAIARFSPVMDAVRDHAAAGGPVLGICNGFQVLTEAGLLPGPQVLVHNGGVEGGNGQVGFDRRSRGRLCASGADQPLRRQLHLFARSAS